jgi:plastocyanin
MESRRPRTLTISASRLVGSLALALGAWLVVAALVAMLSAGAPVRGATHAVNISGFAFSPASITVAVGDTVTWTNADSAAHTATASGGAFDSGTLNQGQSFSFTFATAGTFAYVCDFHSNMMGTITVQAAAAGSPAASAVPNTAASAANAASSSWLLVASGAVLALTGTWLVRAAALRRRV